MFARGQKENNRGAYEYVLNAPNILLFFCIPCITKQKSVTHLVRGKLIF